MKISTKGTSNTRMLRKKITISFRLLSVQPSFMTGEMLQKKWLIRLEAQKGTLNSKVLTTTEIRKPQKLEAETNMQLAQLTMSV